MVEAHPSHGLVPFRPPAFTSSSAGLGVRGVCEVNTSEPEGTCEAAGVVWEPFNGAKLEQPALPLVSPWETLGSLREDIRRPGAAELVGKAEGFHRRFSVPVPF